MSHHYATLNLNISAAEPEILSAFRKLSLKHHPDKGGNVKLFHQISDAKDYCIADCATKSNIPSDSDEDILYQHTEYEYPYATESNSNEYAHYNTYNTYSEQTQLREELIAEFDARAKTKKNRWTNKISELRKQRRRATLAKAEGRKAELKRKDQDDVLRMAQWYTDRQAEMARQGVKC